MTFFCANPGESFLYLRSAVDILEDFLLKDAEDLSNSFQPKPPKGAPGTLWHTLRKMANEANMDYSQTDQMLKALHKHPFISHRSY